MNDERLGSEGQRQAAEWVRGLPEETPSMTWRAALNEQIRAEATLRARRRWNWNLARPAMGLGLATVLAAVVFVPRTPVSTVDAKPKHLEASLVALHDRSVENADIVGTGLDPDEAPATASKTVSDPLDDLESL